MKLSGNHVPGINTERQVIYIENRDGQYQNKHHIAKWQTKWTMETNSLWLAACNKRDLANSLWLAACNKPDLILLQGLCERRELCAVVRCKVSVSVRWTSCAFSQTHECSRLQVGTFGRREEGDLHLITLAVHNSVTFYDSKSLYRLIETCVTLHNFIYCCCFWTITKNVSFLRVLMYTVHQRHLWRCAI